MSQTAYTVNPAVGFRGLLADPGMDKFTISLANGAAAAQGFGIAVRRDAANPGEQFDIFDATGQDVAGILVHTQSQQDPTLAGAGGVALLETASVLRRGRIWVPIEEDIAVGDAVFFRHTAGGGGTEIGAFRNDADTASADALTESTWLQGGTAAGDAVALLEVNLP